MKNKDSIFKEFKDACDIFYERMRVEDKDTIKMHEDNLEKKLNIIDPGTFALNSGTILGKCFRSSLS